mmetsp:Transcript_7068/g.21733  ORF Transcript_7068/g.21733 Transcript_7068/m.21733 type:complete len:101 (+) Transcript_7068:2788-3090(+)
MHRRCLSKGARSNRYVCEGLNGLLPVSRILVLQPFLVDGLVPSCRANGCMPTPVQQAPAVTCAHGRSKYDGHVLRSLLENRRENICSQFFNLQGAKKVRG